MSQKITITIDGKDGAVRPDVALRILELVFETLKSIDANSWAVGATRLEWRVAEASVKNPFALTYSGEAARPEFSPPDVVQLFISGCEKIEKGEKPRHFVEDDFRRMAEVGKLSRQLRSLELRNTQAVHTVRPNLLAQNAKDILRNPERVVSHGSVEGTLVTLQNYPDKPGARASLLTRVKELKVDCHLTPQQAEELNDYLDRHTRAVLYGKIVYENGEMKRIDVESYRIIPDDDKLPTLDDIRAMRLGAPKGTSIEDFMSDSRGDDD